MHKHGASYNKDVVHVADCGDDRKHWQEESEGKQVRETMQQMISPKLPRESREVGHVIVGLHPGLNVTVTTSSSPTEMTMPLANDLRISKPRLDPVLSRGGTSDLRF